MEFLDDGKWKIPFFILIFWKHGAVNEFYEAIDISFQMREAEFPVTMVWKSQSCYTRELVRHRYHARDM